MNATPQAGPQKRAASDQTIKHDTARPRQAKYGLARDPGRGGRTKKEGRLESANVHAKGTTCTVHAVLNYAGIYHTVCVAQGKKKGKMALPPQQQTATFTVFRQPGTGSSVPFPHRNLSFKLTYFPSIHARLRARPCTLGATDIDAWCT